ncbi:MAG: hypothetical protein WC315_09190 [Candidatus Omnitrophota bacterium]
MFHQLVDYMVVTIEQCNYAPSEMREAAILASIIYAERHIDSRIIYMNPDVIKFLNEVETSAPTPHRKL